MAARLRTALLVLVGVFVMHGTQCAAAADDIGHPSPAAYSTDLAPTGPLMHGAAEMAATVVAATDLAPTGSVLVDTADPATGFPAAAGVADSTPPPRAGPAGICGQSVWRCWPPP